MHYDLLNLSRNLRNNVVIKNYLFGETNIKKIMMKVSMCILANK